MKFLELVKMLKLREENKNAIVLVKCGAFFVAIEKDAIWLSKNFKLKTTCITNRICKVGVPINSIYEYIDRLERMDYNFVIYNYSKEIFLDGNKKYVESYRHNGKNVDYTNLALDCENCDYYKKHKEFDNISIFDNLKKMQEEKEKLRNEY